jgi:desulfoferrodoxin-like iron-binding protein
MTTEDQVYRCSVCGNTVKVIAGGEGELVCCNKPMLLKTNILEEGDPAFLGDEELLNIDGDDLTKINADDEDDEFTDDEEDQ